jgi:hypothetical protein
MSTLLENASERVEKSETSLIIPELHSTVVIFCFQLIAFKLEVFGL